MSFDKFKTCKDCPDRTIQPNCHTTCEGYIYRCKINEERKANERKAKEFDSFKNEDEIRRIAMATSDKKRRCKWSKYYRY